MRNTLRQGTFLILGARIIAVRCVFFLHFCRYLVRGATAGEDQLIWVQQDSHTFSLPADKHGHIRCGVRWDNLGKLVIPTKVPQLAVRTL